MMHFCGSPKGVIGGVVFAVAVIAMVSPQGFARGLGIWDDANKKLMRSEKWSTSGGFADGPDNASFWGAEGSGETQRDAAGGDEFYADGFDD
jgi:hypothetical protein